MQKSKVVYIDKDWNGRPFATVRQVLEDAMHEAVGLPCLENRAAKGRRKIRITVTVEALDVEPDR
jgi:hypothetical protein